jgi:NAD-dependent SIR2 family protein deacetylase
MRFTTCEECGKKFTHDDLRHAPHPFLPGVTVHGCPECGEMDLAPCCDEPDCLRPVSCGTPTPEGYRLTCGEHRPE